MCRVYQVPRLAYKCAGYGLRINCFPPRAKHAATMQPQFQPFLPATKIDIHLSDYVVCCNFNNSFPCNISM